MGEIHILKLRDGEEFIKLGQALKATGIADSGLDAKELIQQGLVLVNGEIDERRGRKTINNMMIGISTIEINLENLFISDYMRQVSRLR